MTVTIKRLKKSNSFMEELGQSRYYEFTDQIIRKISSRKLAEMLRSEGYFKDIKLESLAALIRTFRQETVLPKAKRFLDSESTTNTTKAAKAVAEQYDVALELGNIIDLQWIRIERARAEEIEKGEISPETSKEIKLQREILKDLGRFQIQAGLVNSKGGYMSEDIHKFHEIEVPPIDFNLSPEAQRRIADAFKKAMKDLGYEDDED